MVHFPYCGYYNYESSSFGKANLHLHLLDMANLHPLTTDMATASTDGGCGIYSSPYCGDGNRVTAHPNIVAVSTTHHTVI